MNGFLVVDKPTGWTSHDVVAKVRGAARGVKIGHAGTLDPMATGVLVLCLGSATRLAEWATGADKRYLAEVTLGVETDSYDADGTVVARHPVSATRSEIERALASLRGPILQRPPAFSAIKVEGRPVYRAARRGDAVELAERPVVVHDLQLLDFEGDQLRLDVTCSKGTYVRSLAFDLGRALRCGAHLSALRRVASGAFTIAGALPLEEALDGLRARRNVLQPLETALDGLPRLDLSADEVKALKHGQPVAAAHPIDTARAHDEDGALVAIVEARDGAWWPRKVLAA